MDNKKLPLIADRLSENEAKEKIKELLDRGIDVYLGNDCYPELKWSFSVLKNGEIIIGHIDSCGLLSSPPIGLYNSFVIRER